MSKHSTVRPVAQWVEIYRKTPAPESAEKAIANRIIGDLIGYRHKSRHRDRDADELANALQAYAYLLQQIDVKVEL